MLLFLGIVSWPVPISCKISLSSLLSVFKSVTGIDTENDSFFHRQFRCDSGSK